MPTTINATIQSGAPAGFAAAVQAAVQYFENTLTNNVTVNLTFDWAPLTGTAIAQTDPGANFIEVSYDSWKAAMLANATAAGGTADNLLAAQSLPATNTSAAINNPAYVLVLFIINVCCGSHFIAQSHLKRELTP